MDHVLCHAFGTAGNLYRSGDAQSGLLAALDIAPKSLG
jgi:hypothetical protein